MKCRLGIILYFAVLKERKLEILIYFVNSKKYGGLQREMMKLKKEEIYFLKQ